MATALVGCTSPVLPATASPGVVTPTLAPPTASPPPPSQSPSSPPAALFTWAARPDVFGGENGASLVNVAAGPAGLVAVWARPPDEGSPSFALWGSPDGLSWQPINPTGLPDRVYISGLWGAAGLYWLRGSLPDSEDPGILYRSSDGLTWRPSRGFKSDFDSPWVADGCGASTSPGTACPVFLVGTKNVDGVIYRSTDGGDTWAKATVDDATGWQGTQDAAPVAIAGVIATTDGLLAFGNGLANGTDTGGYLQSRFWRSSDGGVTWSRVPNAAPLGELYVRDVVAGRTGIVAVGSRVDSSVAVALSSSDGGRTWSQAATTGAREDGSLYEVFAAGDGFLGLGFSEPAAADDFPVRESVWTSDDGMIWLRGPAGDLDGGVVDDAVRSGDRIVATGRAWTTEGLSGTWEAPHGAAVWTLRQ